MSRIPSTNRPVTLCVFAHPDDEAFGPAGAIATLAATDDVYLLCVTDGDDPGVDENLTSVRRSELEKSAAILGIKKVIHLDYADGGICNSAYHDIADRISHLCQQLQPHRLLTFEPRGVSGHLDHIGLAMISTFVYEHLPMIREIWYFCISAEERALISDYFIYFPDGYQSSEVDLVLDVAQVWEQKIAAIRCHRSQKKDMQTMLKAKQHLPHEEFYLIKKK